MRIEWNGKNLTKKRALFLCWKLWEWLGENPGKKKSQWPGWKNNNGKATKCAFDCPCCEASDMVCTECPLGDYWGPDKHKFACETNKKSAWHMWLDSQCIEEFSTGIKYAKRIAAASKKRYDKLCKLS